MNDLENKQIMISEQNKKFNLEQFLLGDGYEGAVVIITDKQIVMNDCSSYGTKWKHEYILKDIYEAIKNLEIDDNVVDDIIKDGNIYITMIANKFLGKLGFVFAPDVISREQYDILNAFNEKVGEICTKNKNSFSGIGTSLTFNSANDCSSVNGLDDILDNLKSKIGNKNAMNEVVIGDTIDSFKDKDIISTRKGR